MKHLKSIDMRAIAFGLLVAMPGAWCRMAQNASTLLSYQPQ